MKISDMNYIETVAANEVQGGFLEIAFEPPSATAFADSEADAFGRGFSQTWTFTKTDSNANIGAKDSSSVSYAASAGEV